MSKTKPVEVIQELYNQGHRHFGENYIQELLEKAPLLPKDIHWHYIGHLQSNKVKKLVQIPNLYMVECVDSLKLATLLHTAISKNKERTCPLKVLVQVNTSGEESKSGISPIECSSLVKSLVETCTLLDLCGLMTIGSPNDTTCFQTLRECKTKIFIDNDNVANIGFNTEKHDAFELSMGMSADFETAVRLNITTVLNN